MGGTVDSAPTGGRSARGVGCRGAAIDCVLELIVCVCAHRLSVRSNASTVPVRIDIGTDAGAGAYLQLLWCFWHARESPCRFASHGFERRTACCACNMDRL